MQQQVLDAALALVRPTTDASTRSAASQFLEYWNRSPEAWAVYGQWLQSFRTSSSSSTTEHLEPDAVGIQLLCLQLLQAKIRREVTRRPAKNHHHPPPPPPPPPHLALIQSELLATYLHAASFATRNSISIIITPVCICLAALSIRTGHLASLVQSCCTTPNAPPATTATTTAAAAALRLLANIPLELEACADLPPSQVATELQPYIPSVLHYIQQVLLLSDSNNNNNNSGGSDSTQQLLEEAVHALKYWVTIGRVTLSMLNATTTTTTHHNNNNSNGTAPRDASLLVALLHLLSSSYANEKVWVQSSQVLTETILLPTDSCTDTRAAACHLIFQCLTTTTTTRGGFASQLLQRATDVEWEDACHALAVLVTTFVTEEIDSLVQQPSEAMLQLLLQLQNHPLIKVRLVVLECWLTVQEIPTSERHEHWKAPLFRQIVTSLLHQAAYPPRFTSWTADEWELDESDFEEFRHLVKDVLVSAYFLLRAEYVRTLVECVTATTTTDWATKEVALYGLVCPAREICARVKSNTAAASSATLLLAEDRVKTSDYLLQLIHHFMSLPPPSDDRSSSSSSNDPVVVAIMANHPVLLGRITEFVGAFAPAWASKCSPDAIFQLLYYMRTVLLVLAANNNNNPALAESTIVVTAKAVRSLLINCASSSATNPATQLPLRESLRALMDAGLSTRVEEAMITMAEGCTRALMTQQRLNDEVALCQSFSEMVGPVMHRAQAALLAIPSERGAASYSEEAALAVDALGQYLHVIQVIIRFCDAPSGAATTPVADFITLIFPFLEETGERLAQSECILDRILSIHEQILKTAPEVVSPKLQQTMQYVVGIFEKNQHSNSLGYMSSAVEHFGASSEDPFRGLLEHVAGLVFSFIHAERVDERPDLITAFFQLTQRYLLYCPCALIQNSQFTSTVACAVECLSACQGERESTRATLNFLSQLFGWRFLRLSSEAMSRLQTASQLIDQQRELYGARIIQVCIMTLVGGSQALWPASTDCVFAILSSIVPEAGSEENPAEVIPPGITLARQWLEAAMPVGNENAHQIYPQVVNLLLGLVQRGPKSKARAKMLLTDFCKIQNGEMSADALISYSL